ncbi:hypothetical protein PAMP_021873 [Pampus punctatissimus]
MREKAKAAEEIGEQTIRYKRERKRGSWETLVSKENEKEPRSTAGSPRECYTANGEDYRGFQNQTSLHGGKPCLFWNETFQHPYNTLKYPNGEGGLGSHNYCRELHSFVSQFKFTEMSRTVAWPRSPSHKKQNTPSSSDQSL